MAPLIRETGRIWMLERGSTESMVRERLVKTPSTTLLEEVMV
jgi:hypothetical protein